MPFAITCVFVYCLSSLLSPSPVSISAPFFPVQCVCEFVRLCVVFVYAHMDWPLLLRRCRTVRWFKWQVVYRNFFVVEAKTNVVYRMLMSALVEYAPEKKRKIMKNNPNDSFKFSENRTDTHESGQWFSPFQFLFVLCVLFSIEIRTSVCREYNNESVFSDSISSYFWFSARQE